jgi:cytochrome c553
MTRALTFLLAVVMCPTTLANERENHLSDMCAACHGPNGVSQGLIPSLAGLEPAYIASQLMAFRSGTRVGTVMNLIATGLSDADIDAIVSSAESGAQ